MILLDIKINFVSNKLLNFRKTSKTYYKQNECLETYIKTFNSLIILKV